MFSEKSFLNDTYIYLYVFTTKHVKKNLSNDFKLKIFVVRAKKGGDEEGVPAKTKIT